MNEQLFQLEKKRTDAKITQTEMAGYLGVTQSQVSKYEQDPESVPGGILAKWHQICGNLAEAKGIEIEDPRVELRGRIQLIEDYAKVEPDHDNIPEDNIPVNISSLLQGVKVTSNKPRLGVFGAFDSAKSTLLNVISGKKILPTGYQPATSVICLIRHISAKPKWQHEDVWIMRKGFNLDMADDKDHCEKHKMFAGGYESLSQYGTHHGSGSEHKAYAAVLYAESPLLLAADFVDLPGYGHTEDDHDRAEMAKKLVDVMIYTSPINGFINQNDLRYLGNLLRTLPAIAEGKESICPMRNIYIVATHAHHVKHDERHDALNKAAERSYKHLEENAIADRTVQTGIEISYQAFRDRFFTFSADDYEIRGALVSDLIELLTDIIPNSTLIKLQKHVQLAKIEATNRCDHWITSLSRALDEREKAQEEISAIKKDEPDRKQRNKVHAQKIHDMIKVSSTESSSLISKTFAEQANVQAIESMIRDRYDDKKEAQQLAANYLVEKLQKTINDGMRVKANLLGEKIDDFLGNYGPSLTLSLEDGFDFNARVAFLSAMSGIGALGALTAWASIAAAGSNLGAYILIGQIVGWLSSIGISLGGAGTVMSVVAAMGGPVTLAIGAALMVAIGIFSMFGDSWQTKLAKKIHESLVKQKAEKQMSDGIAKYWSDTKTAFDAAVEKVEETYQNKLESLYKLAFSTDKEEIEKELSLAKEMRNFFAGIPWRIIPT